MLTLCVMVMTVEERKCSARALLSRVSIECVSDDVASSRITIRFTPARSQVISAYFWDFLYPLPPVCVWTKVEAMQVVYLGSEGWRVKYSTNTESSCGALALAFAGMFYSTL